MEQPLGDQTASGLRRSDYIKNTAILQMVKARPMYREDRFGFKYGPKMTANNGQAVVKLHLSDVTKSP